MSDLPSEGNGHSSMENNQKVLQTSRLAIDGAASLKSNFFTSARSMVDSVGSLPVPMPGHLNNESNDDEINDDHCEEPLASMETLHLHEMDGKKEIDHPSNNDESSNCDPSDQTTLQARFIEGNLLSGKLVGDDSLDNTDTGSFCHQEQTQMEQSTVPSITCITEIVDGEKVDNQLACFSSSENNRACDEGVLVEEIRESISSVLVKECRSSCIDTGKLGEDEISKARPTDPVAEEASIEAHAGDKHTFLTTLNLDTSSCDEEHGSQIFHSGSPNIITEPKVIDGQDAMPMGASEAACLASQGLHSEPVKEMEEEGNLGPVYCAADGNGASETSIHSGQDAKPSIEENVTKNVDENSSSLVQNKINSIADSEEPVKRDDCNAGDESALDQERLQGLNEDLFLEDHLSSKFVISTGEGSKESIEEDVSDDDEGSISAPPLSATSSMISQSRTMEQETSNAQCSIDHAHVGFNVEGNTFSQTEDGAASSECQHLGCTVDKDGGSSLDSTAGTGLQLSDGCTPVEDEEASSTGGEDTAISPACVQPLRQQRKKININHQFVREIVKIQHDREQYDREQVGRQIHAHQAATLPQAGRKSTDIKEQKNTFSESREIRCETNKQKGFKDVGTHRQLKDAQQKHSTKNKKPLGIQFNNESSHQWSSPPEGNEQSRQAFSHTTVTKEPGKIGRGKQQPSMSIYRPPVVRESLAAEHRNLGEPETFNRQSGAYAMGSSPDNSASSFTEACVPIAGLPHSINGEGSSKMVRSSSGECSADSLEAHVDDSARGMGIKVTFDTEKRQRHIQFSDGLHSFSKGEQVSPAASHSSSGYRVNKDSKFNPRLSDSFQDSKFSSGSRRQIDYDETPSKGNDRHATHAARSANAVLSRPFQDSSFSSGSRQIDRGERSSKGNDHRYTQAAGSINLLHRHPFQDSKSMSGSGKTDHGETPSKGNGHHFMHAARISGSLHGFMSAEPSQTRVRAGKSSDKPTEKRSSFFERADNSANLHNLTARLQKSPPLVRQGSDGHSYSTNSTRRSDWYAGTPSPSSQSFNTPSSQRTASLGPSFERGFFGTTSFVSANVRSEEAERTAMNIQSNIQHQQFYTPRSHDLRGNLKYAVTTDNGRGKRDSQHKNSTRDFSSPFEAMMKDTSRPQAVFSAPAQRSSDANQDSRGYGTRWHAKDHTQTHNQDTLQESLRRSQSDASREAFTQNSQAQLASSPLTESLFSPMPMQEKWGDIVDDLTDSYDYLQIKSDGGERETYSGERQTYSGTLSYGASNRGIPNFPDSKASTPVFRDSKQDRGMPKYNYKETHSSQKHTEVAREHLAYDTPVRKSVFDRLGPQNNFQESILGPPPKMFDSRGVLKASPDALVSSIPPVSTFKSFDTGLYGSQWASQPPSMQHENADDEGREVVVQAYTEVKQRRSKRELYVPRRGS